MAFVLLRKTNSKMSRPICFHRDLKILFWNTLVWGDFRWIGNMFVDSICPRVHNLNTSSPHRLLHNSGPRGIPTSSLQGSEPISLCFAFRLCKEQLGNIQRDHKSYNVFQKQSRAQELKQIYSADFVCSMSLILCNMHGHVVLVAVSRKIEIHHRK